MGPLGSEIRGSQVPAAMVLKLGEDKHCTWSHSRGPVASLPIGVEKDEQARMGWHCVQPWKMAIITGCCLTGPFVVSPHTFECLFCADC